jgi:hypothetical protein
MRQTLTQRIVEKADDLRRLTEVVNSPAGSAEPVMAGPKDFNKNWDKGWNKTGQ